MSSTTLVPSEHKEHRNLAIAALGVVFGDIGTSPLYTMKECFNGPYGVEPSLENILGILSLIFWAITIVISLKYVVFIMRADNKGEGGIMALMSLILQKAKIDPRFKTLLLMLGAMLRPGLSALDAF